MVFVTVMVFACTLATANPKQPASKTLQLFTGAECSVKIVPRQAGNEITRNFGAGDPAQISQ
ncbi:MAG: hypothetical protein DMF20_02235 [Verrucomicrobia bacterium]|nr:MAG: hypothetical protein DMF20_02235 [Verrucomicrobiota bacterium]